MGQSLQILVKETESQVEPLKLCFQENLETKLLSISPAFQACAKPYSVFPCSSWEKPGVVGHARKIARMEWRTQSGDEALGSWV